MAQISQTDSINLGLFNNSGISGSSANSREHRMRLINMGTEIGLARMFDDTNIENIATSRFSDAVANRVYDMNTKQSTGFTVYEAIRTSGPTDGLTHTDAEEGKQYKRRGKQYTVDKSKHILIRQELVNVSFEIGTEQIMALAAEISKEWGFKLVKDAYAPLKDVGHYCVMSSAVNTFFPLVSGTEFTIMNKALALFRKLGIDLVGDPFETISSEPGFVGEPSLTAIATVDAMTDLANIMQGKGRDRPEDMITMNFSGPISRVILKSANVMNSQRFTAGAHSATAAVNQAVPSTPTESNSKSIVLDGLTGTTIKKGEVFTIAGVNFVDFAYREDIFEAATFCVSEDATITAGAATVKITTEFNAGSLLEGTGATGAAQLGDYQSITAYPADNAVVTFLTHSSKSYEPMYLIDPRTIECTPLDLSTNMDLSIYHQRSGIDKMGFKDKLLTTGSYNHKTNTSTYKQMLAYDFNLVDDRYYIRILTEIA